MIVAKTNGDVLLRAQLLRKGRRGTGCFDSALPEYVKWRRGASPDHSLRAKTVSRKLDAASHRHEKQLIATQRIQPSFPIAIIRYARQPSDPRARSARPAMPQPER